MANRFHARAVVIGKLPPHGKRGRMPRSPSRPPLDHSGKWAVVELPAMANDYLSLTPDPHVLITHTEDRTVLVISASSTPNTKSAADISPTERQRGRRRGGGISQVARWCRGKLLGKL